MRNIFLIDHALVILEDLNGVICASDNQPVFIVFKVIRMFPLLEMKRTFITLLQI